MLRWTLNRITIAFSRKSKDTQHTHAHTHTQHHVKVEKDNESAAKSEETPGVNRN